jgi:cytoskeletal protein CcmA (bactofilin family)
MLTLILPGTALAKNLHDDEIVVGKTFTLLSGEELEGNLVVFGGSVTTKQNSRVLGDIVVMGGSVRIEGRVDGNLVSIGGSVRLESSAWVQGSVTVVATSLDRDANARVDGQLITGRSIRVWEMPGIIIPDIPQVFDVRVLPGWNMLGLFFRSFLWAALAVLVTMFLPVPTDRVTRTIVSQPLLSGAVGLLTAIVAPLFLIAIAITLILIPVSLLGVIILIVTWFFGRIALGLEIGRRFADVLKQEWPLAVTAGIGTFLLVLVVDGANMVIPCVGGIFSILVGLLGLGGVLLSRFGNQIYSPATSAIVPPPPPTPPSTNDPSAETPPAEK